MKHELTDEEVMTFAQLKAALDTLTPEQLTMKVRWWGEERTGVVRRFGILQERYIDVTGDGLEPESSYEDDPPGEGDIENELPKGTPILGVD